MPLKIDLKPNELLIIGNTAIRNGDRRSSFTLETNAKFLRETEIITETEATTPCKKLCLTLQVIYLVDDPSEALNLFYAQAAEIMGSVQTMAPYLLGIQQQLEAKRYHAAIKRGRELMAYEHSLLTRDIGERAASA